MRARGRMWGSRREAGQVLVPGDTVGRYEVIRALAKGGMAELYLGRARGIEGFEKLVVLKCIRREYEHEGEFIRMFLDEARLAATLCHPNIAQVFDVDRAQGRYFFAMEYVDGHDLHAIRKAAGSLALEHALVIGIGVAAALHYAHELSDADGRPRGVVHRDVSPSNVIVSYSGAVKLVDFGIARAAGRLTTTREGVLKGKVRYMSPEQCLGHELDRRSDIFSLGAVLYELTSGHPPFDADSDVALAHRIATEDAAPPSSLVARYPLDLEAIVMRALGRDRDARYATAQALQVELEQLAVERGIGVSPVALAAHLTQLLPPTVDAAAPSRVTRTADTRRYGRRSTSARWVGGSMAALALGITAYAAFGALSPSPPSVGASSAPHAATVPAPTSARTVEPSAATSAMRETTAPPATSAVPPAMSAVPPATSAVPPASASIVERSAPSPTRGQIRPRKRVRPTSHNVRPAASSPQAHKLPEGDDAPLP